jgi:hypothetical protein
MKGRASPAVAAAISELANALQVAVPAAARLREHLDAQDREAETLEAALTRAMTAARQLQPTNGEA